MNSKTFTNTLRGGLSALALIAAMGAAEAQEIDFSNLTPDQQDAFGAAVRDYLLANPGVIMEAVAVLEQQEAQSRTAADRAMVEAYADALTDDGYSWVGGNPEGDVTVVEFMDYRCGYCRRAHPEVQALIESDGNIRYILKEFPILGEASLVSSRFAIATQIVAGDEAYAAVHDALMTLEGAPDEAALASLAETLELDADAILAEMQSDEVNRRIADTRALAQSLQISGTPTFVFGGQMVRGYAPLDAMRGIVAEERAAAE